VAAHRSEYQIDDSLPGVPRRSKPDRVGGVTRNVVCKAQQRHVVTKTLRSYELGEDFSEGRVRTRAFHDSYNAVERKVVRSVSRPDPPC
jgi:hypothetical protein